MAIPNTVFIIPYRNRPSHLKRFIEYFEGQIQHRTDLGVIDVIVAHQADNRSFNRGAMKNIGFLYLKRMYPNHYKDITCVFHDIDCIPKEGTNMKYTAVHGKVNHLYGFDYALGGILAMKGGDFDKTNGFPNHWGWGYEDNELSKRCRNKGIMIDRTNLIHTLDHSKIDRIDKVDDLTFTRHISPEEVMRFVKGTHDGLGYIRDLHFSRSGPYLNIFKFNTMYAPGRLVKYNNKLHDFMGNDITRWVAKNFGIKKIPMSFYIK
jgi:hypothetical protein